MRYSCVLFTKLNIVEHENMTDMVFEVMTRKQKSNLKQWCERKVVIV